MQLKLVEDTLYQFEQGLITLTEFVEAMKLAGYIVSSIELVNGSIAFHCYDENDRRVVFNTTYRLVK